jgi:hypothetical protein
MDEEPEKLDIADAREKIGRLWGLNRSLTRIELARALKLSPKYGGDHVTKLEKNVTGLSGPVMVSVQAFLDGYVPRHMASVVKPGYPRGGVR